MMTTYMGPGTLVAFAFLKKTGRYSVQAGIDAGCTNPAAANAPSANL